MAMPYNPLTDFYNQQGIGGHPQAGPYIPPTVGVTPPGPGIGGPPPGPSEPQAFFNVAPNAPGIGGAPAAAAPAAAPAAAAPANGPGIGGSPSLSNYKAKQAYNANPPVDDSAFVYNPYGNLGYGVSGTGYGAAAGQGGGGGGGMNYGGQSPEQLAAIASGMSSAANYAGQVGAAQAGAAGTVAAAQAAADAAKFGSTNTLTGTENTNAANQAIAKGNQATQMGLGELGLEGTQAQVAGQENVAGQQAGASKYGADKTLAGTQAQVGGAEQVASTQNIPALAKIAQGNALLAGLGLTGGTGAGGALGGLAGGLAGGLPGLGGGAGGAAGGAGGNTSSTASSSFPATPQFNPMLQEEQNAQNDALIARNSQGQRNALMDQYGQAGELPTGPGFWGDQNALEQQSLSQTVQGHNQTNQQALQFNASNALPYAQDAQNVALQQEALRLQGIQTQFQNPLYGLLSNVLG